MKPIFPPRLVKGDTIGIISPSDPVDGDNLEGPWESGIACLARLGFKVKTSPNVFASSLGYSASPREKSADINAFFADPEVKAIVCSKGGHNSISALFGMDWNIVRQNPKIVMGLSDITTLITAIAARTGIVTFHGDDLVYGFGANFDSYAEKEFLSRCVSPSAPCDIPSNGERVTVRGGTCEGRLWGGNIHCLLHLAGNRYWPDFDGAILFLEAFQPDPADLDGAVWQLKHLGVFEKITGVLIGHVEGLESKGPAGHRLEAIVERLTADRPVPILKTRDFGHCVPNTVLPIGVRTRMDADRREIVLLEASVR